MASNEVLVLRGTLEGHNGWVTSLATSAGQPNLLLSASRDKTLIDLSRVTVTLSKTVL